MKKRTNGRGLYIYIQYTKRRFHGQNLWDGSGRRWKEKEGKIIASNKIWNGWDIFRSSFQVPEIVGFFRYYYFLFSRPLPLLAWFVNWRLLIVAVSQIEKLYRLNMGEKYKFDKVDKSGQTACIRLLFIFCSREREGGINRFFPFRPVSAVYNIFVHTGCFIQCERVC
jgi:hypothetical protein